MKKRGMHKINRLSSTQVTGRSRVALSTGRAKETQTTMYDKPSKKKLFGTMIYKPLP